MLIIITTIRTASIITILTQALLNLIQPAESSNLEGVKPGAQSAGLSCCGLEGSVFFFFN